MRFLGLGGTDEVGASSYLYRLCEVTLLVDAGLRPSMLGGAAVPLLEPLDETPPDLMVLTHAHLDHVGALPLVKRRFPHLPVFATRATQRIALDVLTDAVRVGESQGAPLYGLDEATKAVAEMKPFEPFSTLPFQGGRITAYPAGHILGAMGLLLETSEGKVFHTGDFSNVATLTTDAAYIPSAPVPVDAVVSEATYGDTLLPGRKEQVRELMEALRGVFARGGRALIPTFALGRAQELILLLLNHQLSGLLPKVLIYLDGAVRTLTQSYESLLDDLPGKLRNYALQNGSPFFREGVCAVKDAKHRARILDEGKPAVILASSGMLSGGVSPLYARRVLQEPDSALFVVGYQDAESPGRRLLELERGGEVQLPTGTKGEYEAVPALCQVARYYLSAHADRAGILAHLSRYPSERVLLMHGEGNARVSLMDALKKDRYVHLPRNGEEVDLLDKRRVAKVMPTPSRDDDAPKLQTRKLKRFKTEVGLEVKEQQVTLTFPEGVDVAHLFPNGSYRLLITRGATIKAQLGQKTILGEGEGE